MPTLESSSILPAGEDKRVMVQQMFDRIAPRYDLMNRLISLRLDLAWRRRAIRALELVRNSYVVDIGCGTGDLTHGLRLHGYRSAGVDLSFGMVAASRESLPLLQADAVHLPFADCAFDGAISGFAVRNFVDLEQVLREAARVVRPGGRLSILEVHIPSSHMVRIGHDLWFRRLVPLLGRLFSDGAAYRYLPNSVAYLPSSATLRSLLAQSGFRDVEIRLLSAGLAQLITATRIGAFGILATPIDADI